MSLFAGAGGLDLGLERAGFETLSALDVDRACVDTLALNQDLGIRVRPTQGRTHLQGARVILGDVAEVSAKDLVPANQPSASPTILAGGPPCQPFSSAGAQLGVKDPRGQLFHHFVRLADELAPDYILFENVRGLATARGHNGVPGEVLADVRSMFEEAGYATRFTLLNSADFGAPQRRVRLFMFGARRGVAPEFPTGSHSRHPVSGSPIRPWFSLGEFLAEMPQPPTPEEVVLPSEALASQLADIPSGSGLRSPGRPEPSRPGGHWGYKQGTFIASLSLPARTVTAASTQDWVRLSGQPLRRLTLKECAGLQGFPPEWTFSGSKANQFKQVGNAVPAVFGEVLGGAIADAVAAGFSSHRTGTSAPLPETIQAAIRYTIRDDMRNGSARPRSPRFDIEP